jgi:hypothetical protein
MKLRQLYWEFEKKGKQNMAAIHTAQAPRDALVHMSMIVNGSVRALTVERRIADLLPGRALQTVWKFGP